MRADRRYPRPLLAVLLLVLASLIAGCDRAPRHPALADAVLARMVAAHEFVFNRHAFGGFSFSPDGTRLIWTGPDGFWRKALHVRFEDSGRVHRFRVGGSGTHWSADGRRLLILDDKSGAENYHLYRLDIEDANAEPVDLTPHPGVRVWLFQIIADDPEHVLILHNRRERTVRDLYRINLSAGKEELIARNPGDAVAPVTDRTGKFLGWRKPAGSVRPRGKPRAPELKDRSALSARSEDVSRAIGVSQDRTRAWVLTNAGRDRTALVRVTGRGQGEVVVEDTRADVARVVMNPAQDRPLIAILGADYPRTVTLDRALEADLQVVFGAYAGERFGWDIASMDPAEQRLVVVVYTHAFRRYHLLDRTNRTQVVLGESRPAEFREAMVAPEAVSIEARDGLTLPAYLLRPRGVAHKALPMVLLVHGGPWSRVQWGDPDAHEDMLRAQFLANRGYAVLIVNFRGSAGFGREFMTAAVGEFGGKMQDDLIDALRWAVDAGIADPKRVALMGHSYGGYATLMGLAQHPATFACGIDIAGPTDLVKLIETFPSYWELELAYWYSYVGDPEVPIDRERMQKMSPVNWASRIERPVLIIQGEQDVRVPLEQSRTMVAHLRQHGKAVEFMPVERMGHSMGYWAHHLLVLRTSERFLADCLGGRSARFDLMEWAARLSGRLPLRP